VAIIKNEYKSLQNFHREWLRSYKIQRHRKKKEQCHTQHPPLDDRRGAADAKEETPPSIKSISAEQGTTSGNLA
jgi:hypothetical protein